MDIKATRSYLINGSGEAPRRSRLRLPPRKSQGERTDEGNEASTIYEIASNKLINWFIYLILIMFSGQPLIFAAISVDCNLPQALPVVTHWKSGLGFSLGASDQYPLYYTPITTDPSKLDSKLKYIYNFNFLPTVDHYIGQKFSVNSISDNEAKSMLDNLCKTTNQSYQLWSPSSYDGESAINSILESAPKNSGVVLIINGITISNSLFTIMLPANWTPPDSSSKHSYPIVFNGFYDLNENLFRLEGSSMASLISQSVKPNSLGRYGSGAIGVLWNGAGAIGSRTINPAAFNEFQQVMNLIEKLGGDTQRIIGFGVSRGGLTPLQMASNPYPHNYKFRYIYAAVPPGHIGTIANITSPTHPNLLLSADWSIGFADAYKLSFIYPDVGNGLQGLSNSEAHASILTGAANLQTADNFYSLGSERMIHSLKKEGTEVFLEIASHDNIVPGFDQLWLYNQYKEAGIPIELRLNYLSGHYTHFPSRQNILRKALHTYTHRRVSGHPHVNNGEKHLYIVNDSTNLLELMSNPRMLFTLELPRYVSPETKGIIVLTGMPHTKYKLKFNFNATEATNFLNSMPQKLNKNGFAIIEFNPKLFPPGKYQLTEVTIRTPDDTKWRSVPLDHRTYKTGNSNEPLVIENLAVHPPDLSGAQIADLIFQSYLGHQREQARGEFKEVSYGIIEPE